jgi:hypothetical protein
MMRLFVIFFIVWSCTLISFGVQAADDERYTFLVAGHAYGAHSGSNIGLHPPLLQKLSTYSNDDILNLFLTGDIVNYSNADSWIQVNNELDSLGLATNFVMGNHDNNSAGHLAFQQKHGGTFYAFVEHRDLFVVLNSTIQDRSISIDQLDFLLNTMDTFSDSIRHIFIFFHEVLWTSHEKYRDLRVNSRSRHTQMKVHSNYWEAVHPLLLESGKKVFVFAGDVAGNNDAIAIFHDRWDNVQLIASGMGEVEDENLLEVTVTSDSILIMPVPLDTLVKLNSLETYTIPEAPDSIMGMDFVVPGSQQVEYWVPDHLYATGIQWYFHGELSGTSDHQQALVDFYSNFTEGTIGAAYVRDGYGTGPIKELNISALTTNVFELEQNLEYKMFVTDYLLTITFPIVIPESCRIDIYHLNGACIFKQNYPIDKYLLPVKVPLPAFTPGLYMVKLMLDRNTFSELIILH